MSCDFLVAEYLAYKTYVTDPNAFQRFIQSTDPADSRRRRNQALPLLRVAASQQYWVLALLPA